MRALATRWRRRRWRGLVAPLIAGLLLALAPPALAVDPTYNEEQVKKKKAEEAAKKKAEAEVKKEAEAEAKPWFFDALFETHWIAVRDNMASNDVYHVLYLRGNYDLPPFWKIPALGRVSLRMDISKRYIAMPNETGFLFGDMRLYFSRAFGFSIAKQDFSGRAYFYWTFPTSKLSIRESNVSKPTLIVALAKALPWNITVFARPFIRLNWSSSAQKTELDTDECYGGTVPINGVGTFDVGGCGGTPNTKWLLGYELQATYNLHVHKPVVFGFTWGQYGYNKYESRDGYNQPWDQTYYWELFAGYNMPWFKPVDVGAYLTLASGREAIENGVYRFHWIDRDETEFYLSISGKY